MQKPTGSFEPLAYSINEACRVSSLGRTRIYRLISEGRLEAKKVGKRTRIPAMTDSDSAVLSLRPLFPVSAIRITRLISSFVRTFAFAIFARLS